MGLNADWKIDFQSSIHNNGILNDRRDASLYLVQSVKEAVVFNLIDLGYTAINKVQAVQEAYAAAGILMINIWEDVWKARRQQVLTRLQSLTGENTTIHGRKCTVVPLEKEQVFTFLEAHHLQGYIKGKYALGLVFESKLVAAATFNSLKMPDKGDQYVSAELLRFCTIGGITVTGGLDKLLNYFIKNYQPSDIMSYADKDWSDGKSYHRLNFNFVTETPPLYFFVDPIHYQRYSAKRLQVKYKLPLEDKALEAELLKMNFIKVFTTGNRKYVRPVQ